jgi:hypothetical protein
MAFRWDNFDLADALEECRKHGDDVLIGFTGGLDDLQRKARKAGVSPRAYAEGRRWWKLHHADNRGSRDLLGPPVDKNWIKGTRFRGVIDPNN